MDEAERYRERARLLRGQAVLTADPQVKAALLEFAKEYEEMASRACSKQPGNKSG